DCKPIKAVIIKTRTIPRVSVRTHLKAQALQQNTTEPYVPAGVRSFLIQTEQETKMFKFNLRDRVTQIRHNNRGQAVFEYAIIIGIVVLALGTMQVYLRRGIQAGIKIAADELGRQEDSVELDPTKGTTQSSLAHSSSFARHKTSVGKGGSRRADVQERSETAGQSEYWSNWEEK
ncbi:unnamed protein product, partial [marine sediment metagenome]